MEVTLIQPDNMQAIYEALYRLKNKPCTLGKNNGEYGTGFTPSDFAALLGAYNMYDPKIPGLSDGCLCCLAWAEDNSYISLDRTNLDNIVKKKNDGWDTYIAFCPILHHLPQTNDASVIEFGMYPQTRVTSSMNDTLTQEKNDIDKPGEFHLSKDKETLLEDPKITKTGKKYNICCNRWQWQEIEEYEYRGVRYVCIATEVCSPSEVCRPETFFPDRTEIDWEEKEYWFKVEPIQWLKVGDVFVSKDCLSAGLSWDNLQKYLQLFLQEISPLPAPVSVAYQAPIINVSEAEKNNSSVDETLLFDVQNGFNVMLHGPSGVGKTQRVRKIDPDLTGILLQKGGIPEDIVGKTDFTTGKWIPPTWYNELCEKCKKEPNKKHILFIDEVTNAGNTAINFLCHLLSDERSIGTGVGKLPENASVVLAGNNREESGLAYDLPEPIFRRCCHIYLKPDVRDWLEWGSERDSAHPERLNIHPLVSNFVAKYANEVFYTSYDEEDPPEFALDPRKWHMVSRIIYATKGELVPAFLKQAMGEALTQSLLKYKEESNFLTLERIIVGQYSRWDVPEDATERFALVCNLRHVPQEDFVPVYDFVSKHLQNKLTLFTDLWINGDSKKVDFLKRFSKGNAAPIIMVEKER